MKISLRIFLVFVVMLVFVSCVFIFIKNRSKNEEVTQNVAIEIDNENPNREVTEKNHQMQLDDEEYFSVVTKEEEALRPENVPRVKWLYTLESLRIKKMMNGEALFYGRIVDQEGMPLPGVRVSGEFFYYETSIQTLRRSGVKTPKSKVEFVTNQLGEFSFVESVVSSLTLSEFTKADYKKVGRSYHIYDFDSNPGPPHQGDPKRPEVFTMKKMR